MKSPHAMVLLPIVNILNVLAAESIVLWETLCLGLLRVILTNA